MLDNALKPIREDLAKMEEILANRSICGVEMADDIARHVMQNAGKRIRPAIFLLSARISQKNVHEQNPDLIDIAAAIELIHTASLLHDDVVDSSDLRRGAITANARWGSKAGVLAGDLLWCVASKMITRAKDHRMMEVIIDGVHCMTKGELAELAFRNDSCVKEESCLEIIEAKTASLFKAAARLGPIVFGMNSHHEHAISSYGHCVGMAFQLSDDALDYTADKSFLGKDPKCDLITKTPTYPLISALNRASEQESSIIKQMLASKSLDQKTLSYVCEIVKKCGGIAASFDLAKKYASEAKGHLNTFEACAEIDSLKTIADYAADRNS